MSELELSDVLAELRQLRAEVTTLRAQVATGTPPLTTSQLDPRPAPTSAQLDTDGSTAVSRRHALRTAGVVAASALGGGAALVAIATPAAATGPSSFDADAASPGVTASSATAQEAIKATATSDRGVAIGAYAPGVDYSIALYGRAGGDGSSTGVVGSASAGRGVLGSSSSGIGVLATSGDGEGVIAISNTNVGVRATGGTSGLHVSGDQSAVRMDAVGLTPTSSSTPYNAGELTPGPGGVLWYCVESGTPGKWRTLAAPSSAGSFYAVTPSRVYDSRLSTYPQNGVLGSGQNRTLSVAASYDPNGALVNGNFIPAGATAVFANVTVVDTVGAGYLAINPGGTTAVAASTINWSASGQILANGISLTLNTSRQITVVNGSGGATQFIIDVTGYWL